MAVAPVMLIGGSEVDRVERMLDRMGVGFERLREPRASEVLSAPAKLLVVSGQFLTRLPLLESEPGDQHRRVCIHGQDFLPLRERLRELGFHYLVQSALDETSLQVFLGQLLHDASPHRRETRLPLGGPVEYHAGSISGTARLGDLTGESCRILGAEGLSVGDSATVVLPAALGGGAALPLVGSVIRARADEAMGPRAGSSVVIRFGMLEPDVSERLARLIRGELIGAKVSPLAAAPPEVESEAAVAEPAPEPEPQPQDRRREVRYPYRGRVEMMELPSDADGALGRDLSLEGICIDGGHRLKPGMKVTLALYGSGGGAPVVVEGEAIRVNEREAALVFGKLPEAVQDKLALLIAEAPTVETLEAPEADRVVPTQILRRNP